MDQREQILEAVRIGYISSFSDLARLAHLAPPDISRIVSGTYQPRPHIAAILAHFRGHVDPAPEVFEVLAMTERKAEIRSLWAEEAKQARRRREAIYRTRGG